MVVSGLSGSDFLISMCIEENLLQVRQTHAIVEGGGLDNHPPIFHDMFVYDMI